MSVSLLILSLFYCFSFTVYLFSVLHNFHKVVTAEVYKTTVLTHNEEYCPVVICNPLTLSGRLVEQTVLGTVESKNDQRLVSKILFHSLMTSESVREGHGDVGLCKLTVGAMASLILVVRHCIDRVTLSRNGNLDASWQCLTMQTPSLMRRGARVHRAITHNFFH